MEMKSCAITGHRPSRFKWKYREDNAGCRRLKKRLQEQIIALYEQGVRYFWVGGTLGVDMWASEILLKLKQTVQYSDLELHLALPFTGYTDEWGQSSQRRMNAIIKDCSSFVIAGIADKAAEGYKKRNYYMVDHADYLLAVYDNNRSVRSGSGMTVNYARKRGLSIILIHPDTGSVCHLTKDC